MAFTLSLIGFGEAAQTFADGAGWNATGHDIVDRSADFARLGVARAPSAREAVQRAATVLNLVTAGADLDATASAAPHLDVGAVWIDLTSVAPSTKRAAAAVIARAGGRYVDGAIMAPVRPAGRGAPIVLAGPNASAGAGALAAAGFTKVEVIAGGIGSAAAIKMIRSVMVKGTEALTAECLAAAHRAGVVDAVAASFGPDWIGRADYNLDRMLVHGTRRADELVEVAATLADLGIDPAMTRAAAGWHRALGELGSDLGGGIPDGLAAKLALLAVVDRTTDRMAAA